MLFRMFPARNDSFKKYKKNSKNNEPGKLNLFNFQYDIF